jgi:tRNA1Val (adenine37-N6)-methyltransferase
MKVCTDSCVFGALINPHIAQSILDIGTGTGLLSLMVAQKTIDALIDVIEIDPESILDAKENIAASPWTHRFTIHEADIRNWNVKKTFDVIICNPPFHVRSTPSLNPKELTAHHSDNTLPFDSLIQAMVSHSHANTQTWVLLPIQEMLEFIDIAEKHFLILQESIMIHHASNEESIRRICRFSKHKEGGCIEKQFSYRLYPSGPYTEEFINAMSPYYLFL